MAEGNRRKGHKIFDRYEQLREDKADVVAYLKRTLQQRTDQILELQARLEGLEQVHASDAKRYEATLANMEADFARAKEQLVSENMVLAKKLDALEEFRIQREQLMAKFEEQEERVESLKKEYEERQVESMSIKKSFKSSFGAHVLLNQVSCSYILTFFW